MADPIETDPDKYIVVFENDRVRVLEYRDEPGGRTSPHDHGDSVMVTLTGFDRRVSHGARSRDVTLRAGEARWRGGSTRRRMRGRTSAARPHTRSSSNSRVSELRRNPHLRLVLPPSCPAGPAVYRLGRSSR